MVLTSDGAPSASAKFAFGWLSSPGTLLLITAVVIGLVYGLPLRTIGKIFIAQVYKLRWTFLTIASVLALAYVMNLSGQTLTIGHWIAGAGAIFAFPAPILGWIGTAVTGSGTSATALFASCNRRPPGASASSPGCSWRRIPSAARSARCSVRRRWPSQLRRWRVKNPTCCERRCPGVWAIGGTVSAERPAIHSSPWLDGSRSPAL